MFEKSPPCSSKFSSDTEMFTVSTFAYIFLLLRNSEKSKLIMMSSKIARPIPVSCMGSYSENISYLNRKFRPRLRTLKSKAPLYMPFAT